MTATIRYGIIANPAAGNLNMDRRTTLLGQAADILRATVHGLEATSADELARCAREQSERCDVLVVAGGDGTMSLVINAIDLSATALAFLPFGTGNALTHALHYRGGLPAIAGRIRAGGFHRCDLIDCDGRHKAFMASVGIDGTMIGLYERYRLKGHRGIMAHLRAGARAFLREYRPTGARIEVDRKIHRTRRLVSLMVVKQPFFGLGLKVVPRARWDDAKLHAMTIEAGLPTALTGLITGFTIGNRVGLYRSGERLRVRLEAPLTMQVDGELGWTSDRFAFRVLPGVLQLKC